MTVCQTCLTSTWCSTKFVDSTQQHRSEFSHIYLLVSFSVSILILNKGVLILSIKSCWSIPGFLKWIVTLIIPFIVLHTSIIFPFPQCSSFSFRLVTRKAALTRIYNEITIPAGMNVLVDVWGLHRDPDLWEDPDTFDPERYPFYFSRSTT